MCCDGVGASACLPSEKSRQRSNCKGYIPVSYVSSWSGGKDACLACFEVMCDGYAVSHLMNFVSEGDRRVRSHGTGAEMIRLQAEAVDIPLLQRETTWDTYEKVLKDVVRSVIPQGVKGIIFGDICLQEHVDWVERVCGELGVEVVEPLWGREPERILLDFIAAGFEAIVVSTKAELLGEEWIGHKVDKELLRHLKKNGIDICGEHGEYHTFVTNGPVFKKGIKIHKSRTIMRDDRWFLETLEYSYSNTE